MMPTVLDKKFEGLQQILRDLGSVAVAFSAGVDSTFLLKVAIDALGPDKVVAVTGKSDSLSRGDFAEAASLARSFGAKHVVIETDEFDNPDYTSNPTDRCYFCKANLFEHIRRVAADSGLSNIVVGTNVDDLSDYRPGNQAAAEGGVRAPVAEAGLTKADVRALSKRLGLKTFDKPASPCLASRIPYGEPVTSEKLSMIDAGETFLRGLGIAECRVRHHEQPAAEGSTALKLARLEVPMEFISTLAQPETAAKVNAHFRGLGYNYVALDLRGFRSGSLNEVIPLETDQSPS